MRRCLQQISSELVVGIGVGLFTFLIYLLTMAHTVSFWDCGEFIATSYTFGVGHPPGAPLYQLLAHLFTLCAHSPTHIAWWSNLLSALCAGATNMFLFWTLYRCCRHLGKHFSSKHHRSPHAKALIPALIGTLCYAFCDTAWFSAVESEVYSPSMFFSSIVIWAMLRWSEEHSPRWLILTAFLLGLSACVHEMGLLCVPTVLTIILIDKIREYKEHELHFEWQTPILCIAFFLVGLSPYVIVPLRAQTHPVINNTDPSTWENFKMYIGREQYENGPSLYPRIWRTHPGDDKNYADWSGFHGKEITEDGSVKPKPNLLDNLQFFVGYQLGYMFLRYWVQNFGGRHFWELFYLPLLLGLIGMLFHWKRHRLSFWPLAALILFSGLALAVYLNMPVYQPRERDYAFVLSFYAYAFWIGIGALYMAERIDTRYLLSIPLLMLCVNYSHNDRSHNYAAYDVAHNILHSCEPDAILFTTGDNDTYPLWYLQEVEGIRKDVRLINVSLLTTQWYAHQTAPECVDAEGNQLRGFRAMFNLIDNNIEQHPIYMTHYTERNYREIFPNQLQLSGNAFRLQPYECGSVALDEAYRHAVEQMQWRTRTTTRSDIVDRRFYNRYKSDLNTIATALDSAGHHAQAAEVRSKIQQP